MDNFDISKNPNALDKKLFRLKPATSNGLVLSINEASNNKKGRFILCDFQSNGNTMALANTNGQIYFIDFLAEKYWTIKTFNSITCIKMAPCNSSEILTGETNGTLNVLNIDSGDVIAKLFGHSFAIISISCSNSNVCISASKHEAILWDLSTYGKMQVLSLQKDCRLKFVNFVPVSSHILVCYQDDIIQIWQQGSFRSLKQFLPSNWKNYCVKSISFSRNGEIMVVSGYLPVLAVFLMDKWKMIKLINLPDYINTVKKIQFIPENFDGGCNRLLAILSGNGIIYFYNIELNVLMTELKSKSKIINFFTPETNIKYVACLLCSGEVELYDVSCYTMQNENTIIDKAQELKKDSGKIRLKNYCRKNGLSAKNEIINILDVDKLKAIIKEYQEFPEIYRSTIWERILKLPNNTKQYNAIVDHVTILAFNDLSTTCPLEDKVTIRCLRHLLNNLVTWCPFFAQVDFLPYFLFPFVKIFHKKPVACFELCCTLIVNWCQHWFEYHPLPPVNILAIIDNIILEHEACLLAHYSRIEVKPILYSWTLLESAFSEVLASSQWLKFWDHIFINEPSFLLCAVAAFNIIHKSSLLGFSKEDEFFDFFHSQRPTDVRKLIKKAYYILNNTSKKIHPRQYLREFRALASGKYPVFDKYPKEVVNFQKEHVDYLEDQLKEINEAKQRMSRKQKQLYSFSDVDIKNEEDRRFMEVEKACIKKIKSYQDVVSSQQEQLSSMREELLNREKEFIKKSGKILAKNKTDKAAGGMEILMEGLDLSKNMHQSEITRLRNIYLQKYSELLEKEHRIRDLDEHSPSAEFFNELRCAQKKTLKLNKQLEMDEASMEPSKAQVAYCITLMNRLIHEIEKEIIKNDTGTSTSNRGVPENIKVRYLEKEATSLQKEISQLLKLFAENRKAQSQPLALSQEFKSKDDAGTGIKTVSFSK